MLEIGRVWEGELASLRMPLYAHGLCGSLGHWVKGLLFLLTMQGPGDPGSSG